MQTLSMTLSGRHFTTSVPVWSFCLFACLFVCWLVCLFVFFFDFFVFRGACRESSGRGNFLRRFLLSSQLPPWYGGEKGKRQNALLW